MAVPLLRILGMVAGLLIIAVGAFVLRAKPHSPLHRLFFAFAMADGASTFLFDLAYSPVGDFARLHAYLIYFYAFIALVVLLALFAARFPRQLLPRGGQRILVTALLAAGGLAFLLHLVSYAWFWEPARRAGDLAFDLRTGGRIVYAAFALVTAFIVLRMTRIVLREPSASHRLQGALVLGGLALGFAPGAAGVVLIGARDVGGSFLAREPDVVIEYWASLATVLGVLAAVALLLFERRADRVHARNILLACLVGVIVLALVGTLTPQAPEAIELAGLLLYPLFLAYAIARYEVLDIDEQLRRAATASIVAGGFAAVFLLFEVMLENALQDWFSATATSTFVATLIAALLTAAISVPMARLLKRLAGRFAPALVRRSDVELRKREIYRHALEGAAEDGVIDPDELSVLRRLRESLGISDPEHEAMAREVAARAGAA